MPSGGFDVNSFPFHIILDSDFKIVSIGHELQRELKEKESPGTLIGVRTADGAHKWEIFYRDREKEEEEVSIPWDLYSLSRFAEDTIELTFVASRHVPIIPVTSPSPNDKDGNSSGGENREHTASSSFNETTAIIEEVIVFRGTIRILNSPLLFDEDEDSNETLASSLLREIAIHPPPPILEEAALQYHRLMHDDGSPSESCFPTTLASEQSAAEGTSLVVRSGGDLVRTMILVTQVDEHHCWKQEQRRPVSAQKCYDSIQRPSTQQKKTDAPSQKNKKEDELQHLSPSSAKNVIGIMLATDETGSSPGKMKETRPSSDDNHGDRSGHISNMAVFSHPCSDDHHAKIGGTGVTFSAFSASSSRSQEEENLFWETPTAGPQSREPQLVEAASFPFHLILDQEFKIISVGHDLQEELSCKKAEKELRLPTLVGAQTTTARDWEIFYRNKEKEEEVSVPWNLDALIDFADGDIELTFVVSRSVFMPPPRTGAAPISPAEGGGRGGVNKSGRRTSTSQAAVNQQASVTARSGVASNVSTTVPVRMAKAVAAAFLPAGDAIFEDVIVFRGTIRIVTSRVLRLLLPDHPNHVAENAHVSTSTSSLYVMILVSKVNEQQSCWRKAVQRSSSPVQPHPAAPLQSAAPPMFATLLPATTPTTAVVAVAPAPAAPMQQPQPPQQPHHHPPVPEFLSASWSRDVDEKKAIKRADAMTMNTGVRASVSVPANLDQLVLTATTSGTMENDDSFSLCDPPPKAERRKRQDDRRRKTDENSWSSSSKQQSNKTVIRRRSISSSSSTVDEFEPVLFRILIVEARRMSRRMHAKLLTAIQPRLFTVDEAADAAEACEHILRSMKPSSQRRPLPSSIVPVATAHRPFDAILIDEDFLSSTSTATSAAYRDRQQQQGSCSSSLVKSIRSLGFTGMIIGLTTAVAATVELEGYQKNLLEGYQKNRLEGYQKNRLLVNKNLNNHHEDPTAGDSVITPSSSSCCTCMLDCVVNKPLDPRKLELLLRIRKTKLMMPTSTSAAATHQDEWCPRHSSHRYPHDASIEDSAKSGHKLITAAATTVSYLRPPLYVRADNMMASSLSKRGVFHKPAVVSPQQESISRSLLTTAARGEGHQSSKNSHPSSRDHDQQQHHLLPRERPGHPQGHRLSSSLSYRLQPPSSSGAKLQSVFNTVIATPLLTLVKNIHAAVTSTVSSHKKKKRGAAAVHDVLAAQLLDGDRSSPRPPEPGPSCGGASCACACASASGVLAGDVVIPYTASTASRTGAAAGALASSLGLLASLQPFVRSAAVDARVAPQPLSLEVANGSEVGPRSGDRDPAMFSFGARRSDVVRINGDSCSMRSSTFPSTFFQSRKNKSSSELSRLVNVVDSGGLNQQGPADRRTARSTTGNQLTMLLAAAAPAAAAVAEEMVPSTRGEQGGTCPDRMTVFTSKMVRKQDKRSTMQGSSSSSNLNSGIGPQLLAPEA